MELITPSFGLLFWTLIGFGILFFILAKFAWPVITKMISQREKYIEDQLVAAEKIRQDMDKLQSDHQKFIDEAKAQKEMIISEAHTVRDQIITDAKEKAIEESHKIIEEAKKTIHFEKMKAVTEVKNEIAHLSIEIAERLIKEELSDSAKNEKLVNKWVNEIEMN